MRNQSAIRFQKRARTALAFAFVCIALVNALSAQTSSFTHRWAGLIFDAFTLDGEEYWLVEDGGRLRHSDSLGGAWTFQDVPTAVKDTLNRVFFLPPVPPATHPTIGWAVGQNGYIIKTTEGGQHWLVYTRIAAVLPGSVYEELFDVHFVDEDHGWVLGTHGIWMLEVDGGLSVTPLVLLDDDSGHTPLDPEAIELYALDIVPAEGGGYLGLATAQPGLVLKATGDLSVWNVVWDIRDYVGATHFYPLVGCERTVVGIVEPGQAVPEFEPWDIEISRHPTDKLAVLVGGIEAQCGMIFASTNDGDTWIKEYHECQSGNYDCTTDPLYNDDPSVSGDVWRHKVMTTLYGVSIAPDTNEAFAAGYNAQHLVRNPTTHEWEDRSSFTNRMFTVADPVVFPLLGAAAGPDGKGILTGCGGHLRMTSDHGQTWQEWDPDHPGTPYRINDLCFISDSTGFIVGQAGRLGKTTNGGLSFPKFGPEPGLALQDLIAITFADGVHGVIVGGPYPDLPGQNNPNKPRVLYTESSGNFWDEPDANAITLLEHASAGLKPRCVTWSANDEYWAAGERGLIMHGHSWGETWSQCRPTDPAYDEFSEFQMFDFSGVSFIDEHTGVFVGTRSDNHTAFAFEFHSSGSAVSWTSLTSGLSDVVSLRDVTIAGNAAYAVGTRISGSPPVRVGVLLKSVFSSSFGAFSTLETVFACDAGEDLGRIGVMNEIEYVPATGELWIGGECGRVWCYTIANSTLTEVKSQTDAHILGISFPPSGTVGYFGGQRLSNTQQCVVKYTAPQ